MSHNENRTNYKDEFEKYIKEAYNDRKSFFELLTQIMDSMIDNEHPCIKEALRQLKEKKHYQNKDWNPAILNELNAIDPSTYTRIKDYDYIIKLYGAVSICIILCLSPNESEELLNSAGYSLKKKCLLHRAYSFAIKKNYEESADRDKDKTYCYMRITQANEILKELGIDEKHFLGIHTK